MKKILFTFSAVSMIFMWGKSDVMASMVEKGARPSYLDVKPIDPEKTRVPAGKIKIKKKVAPDDSATLFSLSGGAKVQYERNNVLGMVNLDRPALVTAVPSIKPKNKDGNATLFSLSAVKDKVKAGAKKVKDKVKKGASKAMKLAQQHGPKAVELVKKHGPKVMDLVKKHGPDAIAWMHEHGHATVKNLIDRHGDRLVGMAIDHGPKVIDAVKKYGPTALDLIGKGGKVALDMMMK